jgi:hypothetical protein
MREARKILLFFIVTFFNSSYADTNNEEVLKKINSESAEVLINNLNNNLLSNYPSDRKICESNLNNLIKNKEKLLLDYSKNIKTYNERAALILEAAKIRGLAPVLSRAGCFVKYRFELEKILYKSFYTAEETPLFQKALLLKHSKSIMTIISSALTMKHEDWIKENLDLIDKNESMRRNNGFNEILNNIIDFYLTMPTLGCINISNKEKIYQCR